MKIRRTLSTGIGVALMLVVAAPPAYSSQGTCGEISMTFSEPLVPNAPWHIKIWALPYFDVENWSLTIRLWQANREAGRDIELWKGIRRKMDTVFGEYAIEPLPLGNYMLSADLAPIEGMERSASPCYAPPPTVIFYITIRENKVYTSRASWSANFHDEIMDELKARGLDGISGTEMWEKAPDLAERIRNLNRVISVAPVHVQCEPPKQRPTLDSSKGIIFGGVKQGIHMQGTGDEVKYNPPKHPPTRTGRQPAYPYDKPSIDPPRERPAPPPTQAPQDTQQFQIDDLEGRRAAIDRARVDSTAADSADTSGSPP